MEKLLLTSGNILTTLEEIEVPEERKKHVDVMTALYPILSPEDRAKMNRQVAFFHHFLLGVKTVDDLFFG